MYAIIEAAGRQYRVQPGDVLDMDHQEVPGEKGMQFDRVLVVGQDDGKVQIGTPLLAGALVKAELVEQLRGEKLVIIKKKRRKGYRRKQGHRAELSRIRILEIQQAAS